MARTQNKECDLHPCKTAFINKADVGIAGVDAKYIAGTIQNNLLYQGPFFFDKMLLKLEIAERHDFFSTRKVLDRDLSQAAIGNHGDGATPRGANLGRAQANHLDPAKDTIRQADIVTNHKRSININDDAAEQLL